ncbi:MAG TPA: PPC domain-containing protein [Marmoricola sp.]|nr:PPC domain-containing protein [Marmoricola sp.]
MGLQVARKVTDHRPTGSANPYLGLVPDLARADYAGWAAFMERRADARMRARDSAREVVPFGYDEEEPAGISGSNDRPANAEAIPGFGTGTGEESAVRIAGQLSPPRLPARRINTREDQGSIPKATNTGIPRRGSTVVVRSRIGDGPHGRARSGRGDFDFYKVRARAGRTIFASTAGGDERFDTILVLFDAEGTVLAANDDFRGLQSELRYEVADTGSYYVMVSGYLSLPRNPFRSGSGSGAESQGNYRLKMSTVAGDRDMYAVELQSGDVLGGTVSGRAADLTVRTPNGKRRIGSTFDATYIYPMASPLPGGGRSTFAYVAEEAGKYTVSTSQGKGRYSIDLEVYRPGSEASDGRVTQRLFLDFDGARVNTGVWFGRGVSHLSPLSAFLARWQLPSSALDAVIDQVVATVQENVDQDLRERGLNDEFRVEVLNSRDHADVFGQPNVSRVVVGGTIDETWLPTIGIAQSIDPGNFEREETALVLLDVLSGSRREWGDASLNYYLRPRSDRVGFVGTAVGNVTSHEIGHLLGSFHVDQFNDVLNLMDQGGNFPLLYGVGADGVGGTADDPDVDFGVDTFNPSEGFTGLEDTLNNTAWGSSGG